MGSPFDHDRGTPVCAEQTGQDGLGDQDRASGAADDETVIARSNRAGRERELLRVEFRAGKGTAGDLRHRPGAGQMLTHQPGFAAPGADVAEVDLLSAQCGE